MVILSLTTPPDVTVSELAPASLSVITLTYPLDNNVRC